MRPPALGVVAIAGLFGIGTTHAQPVARAPLVAVDVQGSIGWVHVDRDDLSTGRDWDHGVAQAAAGIGRYWTDHIKTELEFQAESAAEFHSYDQVSVAGRLTYLASHSRVRSTGFGLGISYQFFRNAWLHPYLGSGVDVRWESMRRQFEPALFWDDSAKQSVIVTPARSVGPETSLVARPFVLLGLKTYVSPRSFLRTDVRVNLREGLDTVVLRAGVGVDF